jgi:hypothetical protein
MNVRFGSEADIPRMAECGKIADKIWRLDVFKKKYNLQ